MDTGKIWIIVILVVSALCLCLCVGLAVAGGLIWSVSGEAGLSDPQSIQIPFQPDPTEPAINVEIVPFPAEDAAYQTLQNLRAAEIPGSDLRDLAARFKGLTGIPPSLPAPAQEYQVGDIESFWVANLDNNQSFSIKAKLAAVTPSSYFWVENGLEYNSHDLNVLASAFNDKIYPTNREFFGSEWYPGIDNDPRLYILYASGLGSSVAGYFSSADAVHPLAHPYSNGHEMFLLSADNTLLDDDFTYGVLAHEFQHSIHWYRDRNEESWLNEGFSELAAFLNGYNPGGFDYLFALNPDLQLNDWPNGDDTNPHYGASFLFVHYFLEQFGEEATRAVVSDPDNGFESIDQILAQMGAGSTSDDVFSHWTIANYLNDTGIADGVYGYETYDPPTFYDTETITDCDNPELKKRTVSQYGTDYIRFDCGSDFTLTFQGNGEVSVLPAGAYSGDFAFWSNRVDESDSSLTQTFDFRTVSSPIEMSYKVWYDLETGYDYLYLTASTDGQTWHIITTPACTAGDTSGNSYGCGYTGQSGGYVTQTVDLSRFAGKEVQLRFEYITDTAATGEGLLLDDVSIPAIQYFSDFEKDDGGWDAQGFVRMQNRLPQTYRVSLIFLDREPLVETLTLDANQSFTLDINTASSGEVVLVVSGTTRFTRQPALYQFMTVER